MAQESGRCSGRFWARLDLVAQHAVGAGVGRVSGAEVLAQLGDGFGLACGGHRVQADGQDAGGAGVDVAGVPLDAHIWTWASGVHPKRPLQPPRPMGESGVSIL